VIYPGSTRLERAIAPLAAAHPGKSGVFPLGDGRDAFAARVLLAQFTERTLDVQYYIWADDKTGTMMFNALRGAAARGVRVRLLLTTIIRPGSTRYWPRSIRMPTLRCGCSTRCASAGRDGSTT
jgi:phosphatidylserine/phosphatidylglycerophosphate/cardiolipin synthase-like enzyme